MHDTSAASLHTFTAHHPHFSTSVVGFEGFFARSPSSDLSTHFGIAFKFESFESLIRASIQRFDLTAMRSRAVVASTSMAPIDLQQVQKDSSNFINDPLSLLNSFAKKSIPSRLNFIELASPEFDDFTDIALLRQIAIEVTPFFDPAFVPSTTSASLRPQMTAIQPAIDALFQTNYSKGEVSSTLPRNIRCPFLFRMFGILKSTSMIWVGCYMIIKI